MERLDKLMCNAFYNSHFSFCFTIEWPQVERHRPKLLLHSWIEFSAVLHLKIVLDCVEGSKFQNYDFNLFKKYDVEETKIPWAYTSHRFFCIWWSWHLYLFPVLHQWKLTHQWHRLHAIQNHIYRVPCAGPHLGSVMNNW